MLRPPPTATLFPYTTLFRSVGLRRFPDRVCARRSTGGHEQGLRSDRRGLRGLPDEVCRGMPVGGDGETRDRKSTRLNSSHSQISYAVFCLKKIIENHLVLDT